MKVLKKTDYGGLETHSLITKFVRVFSVPILNHIPELFLKKIMKKSSKDAGTVVDKGGTTHALEAMYTRYHRRLFSRGVFQGLADLFWHHAVSQPKAIRNRLKIVKEIVKKITVELIEKNKVRGNNSCIDILSVAGGSSRATIHTVVELKKMDSNCAIKVVTLDKDKSALGIGMRIAQENNVSECFSWAEGKASDIQMLLPSKKFDIVETVGLLDYFEKDRAVRLIKNILTAMKDGGYLVVANVVPNSEMSFTHKTGWPKMFYRQPRDMEDILTEAGFKNSDIIIEPLKIHMIAVAGK